MMRRLRHLPDNQKRFVRDTAHQLRTPLAVLKVLVQSALRGDVKVTQGLLEISHTVERATQLANQMLALAKVAQLAHEIATESVDWAGILREVALDLSPLVADKALDFEIDTTSAPVQTHAWMLHELSRNLLHNAIRYSPEHGRLQVRLLCDARHAALVISGNGPGISDELRKRLFQPFSAGQGHSGSGLGLAWPFAIRSPTPWADKLSGSTGSSTARWMGSTPRYVCRWPPLQQTFGQIDKLS
jgi:two-component system sensor histidine kinase TctE